MGKYDYLNSISSTHVKSGEEGLKSWLWLRALAAIAEDPGSVPSTHKMLITICNSSSRRCDTLLTSVSHVNICDVQTYTQAHTPNKQTNISENWEQWCLQN